jgi:putative redox protein
VFTRVHLVYRVTGKGLDARQVERAVKLSKDKYCSATAMLAKTAEVSFEIVLGDDAAANPAA